MKKLLKLPLFLVLCLAVTFVSAQNPADNDYGNNDEQPVSYQTFYDQLQPYGNWIDYPGYGYVWQPNAGPYFKPYETNGHWVSTIDGWAWASDYEWGWATFHYGRWLFEPSIGWMWVPGYEWAPAWVTWGQYGDDYAWAPLAPGINISIGSTWRAPYNYWSFIPRNYIGYPNQSRYLIRGGFNQGMISNITIINNYNSYNNREYYHRGPDYREVERYTHRSISPLAISATQRPGAARINQRQFEIYRPNIARGSENNNRNYAPGRVRSINEIRGNSDNRNGGGMVNQGNTNDANRSGDYRNRSFNNTNNDVNRRNNVSPGTPQTTIDPNRDQRATGGYQQNNNWRNNAGRGQAPAQPSTTSPQPSVTPPVNNNQSQNQQRGRWQQSQQNNGSTQPNASPQTRRSYQDRNMQRSNNTQQHSNDQFRSQQRPEPQIQRPAPNNAPVRNSQVSPRQQAASTERGNGRDHERN